MEINLKDLWNKQKIIDVNPAGIYKKTNNYRKKQFFTLVVLNITLLLTALFIGYIWFAYSPRLITTKIGITLAITSIVVFLLANNKKYSILKKPPAGVNANEYLTSLIKLKKHFYFLQKVTMKLYYLFLSSGLLLYMYEYTSKTILSFLIGYGLTLGWILFNWFYILPKKNKKEELKINELIAELEILKKNLNEQ